MAETIAAIRFRPQTLARILCATDLVKLIGRSIKLKRAGDLWKGLCPFHEETVPSFTVNAQRGIFHCFGCGAGGDAFAFLMRHKRIGFAEAVHMLAQRAKVGIAK